MEDFISIDDEECCWDEDSIDGIESVDVEPYARASVVKVITKSSLLAAQTEDVQRVMDLLSLKEHHARTLLIYYRWSVDSITTMLVENGEERLLSLVGIPLSRERGQTSQSSFVIICTICFNEVGSAESTLMDCGHCFCNECWTNHFIVQIDEGHSRRIRCMDHRCKSICDESVVRDLVSAKNPKAADRFERSLLESYIDDNSNVKWCPSIPHCGNAIRVEGDPFCEVECICGVQFCFNCSSEPHSPCSCLMWAQWAKKCMDEAETAKWIVSHTNPCPKCHKPVEKNGGCNLVHCVCGQSFCWLCGRAAGYNYNHGCGGYTGEEYKEKKLATEKYKWHRFVHYHTRYLAHKDSLELESKLKVRVEKMTLDADNKELWVSDSWLTNGLHRQFRCRRILSYSYVFAYYLFDDTVECEFSPEERKLKQNLFEDQQQQFEGKVELLSELIEKSLNNKLSKDNFMNLRMQVVNMTILTDNLCRKMYECIENELLGSLQSSNHVIASYKSKGAQKATELGI